MLVEKLLQIRTYCLPQKNKKSTYFCNKAASAPKDIKRIALPASSTEKIMLINRLSQELRGGIHNVR